MIIVQEYLTTKITLKRLSPMFPSHDPRGSDNVIDEYKNIHKPNAPKGVKVELNVGDMLIYSGCELEHWREPFQGNLCGQVFLHYNHADGPFAKSNLYDKRAMLGLPTGAK
jgi:hypothetical protein